MPGPSIIHGQETAAYERIRAFVVGQVAKAGDSPMRLDSYRSLAKRFGVTQTTVMKALKDLISDGFLTTKPGIGVFTNPVRLGYSERVKLIGCFTGDGQNVLFARNYWQFFPAFADAILKSSREYQLQPAFLAVPVARTKAEDIVSMGFDAVLWSLPTPPVFELLRDLRKKMSVLALGHRCPGVGGVHYGAAQVLSAARLMFAEGRRKVMLFLPPESLDEELFAMAMAGLERLCSEFGAPFDRSLVVEDSREGMRGLAELLARVRPDGIVFMWGVLRHWKVLKENLDVSGAGCRFCADEASISDDIGYRGWVFKFDLAEDARLAAADLAAQFASPGGAATLDRQFGIRIVDHENGRDVK